MDLDFKEGKRQNRDILYLYNWSYVVEMRQPYVFL